MYKPPGLILNTANKTKQKSKNKTKVTYSVYFPLLLPVAQSVPPSPPGNIARNRGAPFPAEPGPMNLRTETQVTGKGLQGHENLKNVKQ
jgi:hypothetical protein